MNIPAPESAFVPEGHDEAPLRHGRFRLQFARAGRRTFIARQFVSYPFHMTRPFELDAKLPHLLTVYQQSSSGGLYRDDRLSSVYALQQDAAAHVTTQAATVVHDCQGTPAYHDTKIDLSEGSYLALTPDPLVLFPGAASSAVTSVTLAEGAALALIDSFSTHDPVGSGRPFDRISSDVTIRDQSGRLLARDFSRVQGQEFFSTAAPAGDWRVVITALLVGAQRRLPDQETLSFLSRQNGVVAGASRLPNDAGWIIRCLAKSAHAAHHVIDEIFTRSVVAALGEAPLKRRK